MKKIALIILILFLALEMIAQIPNGGFENWNAFNGYEDPHDWATLNYLSLQGYPVTATKTTDHYTGSYALRLETKTYNSGSKTELLRSLAVAGDIKKTTPNGFAFSTRPASLVGYFKYSPQQIDTATIFVTLTKWDKTLKSPKTISRVVGIFTNTHLTYTKFSIDFHYTSLEVPDSAIVFISSSNNKPVNGSVFFIDDLSFTGITTALPFENSQALINIYPNPVSTELNIKNLPADASILDVTDLTGKNIQTISLSIDNNVVQINTENYLPGIYFCNIKNSRGEKIYNSKFSVQK